MEKIILECWYCGNEFLVNKTVCPNCGKKYVDGSKPEVYNPKLRIQGEK